MYDLLVQPLINLNATVNLMVLTIILWFVAIIALDLSTKLPSHSNAARRTFMAGVICGMLGVYTAAISGYSTTLP